MFYRDNLAALHIACKQGNLQIVQLLLKQPNIDLNANDVLKFIYFNAEMQNPLHYACQNGNIDIVKLLLNQKGIDKNHKNAVLFFSFFH